LATINSITFNEGSTGVAGTYNTGDTITATTNYVPDTPALVPQTFTLTSTVTDAAGNQTATQTSEFVVNATQANGDTVSDSDTGSRTWTPGTQTVNADGSLSQPFSATA
jgi:hypothetical protein